MSPNLAKEINKRTNESFHCAGMLKEEDRLSIKLIHWKN